MMHSRNCPLRPVMFRPVVPMKRPFILTTKPRKAGNKLFQFTKHVRIIFSLSRLIGIFPFRLTRERTSLSIPFAIYSIITNCFVIFFITNAAIVLFETKHLSKSVPLEREKFVIMIVFIAATGFYVYSTLSSLSRARYLNDISEELEYVDRLMYRTCHIKRRANYRIRFYIGGGLVFLHVLYMVNVRQINRLNEILIYSSVWLVTSQFSVLTDVITSRLRELCKCQNHILRMGNFRKRCDVVVALTEIHSKLCDVCSILRNSYKRLLTVLITVCFVRTVTSLFYVYVNVLNDVFDISCIIPLRKEVRPMNQITAVLFTAYTMWEIVADSNEISDEIEKFYVILYRLMIHDKTKILLENKRLTTYIAVKRQVTFSACGFFNLDYKLLHSILAAVTTYFVIFISWD
ncbi:Gustatory receptor 29a [Halyomorpha halys]|nr:Gustatory receptor 29a [Halyomorpha halys]